MATVYALEKLRGHLCVDLFTADPPPGAGTDKYDATAGAMIAVLKYGTGMRFHRLDRHNDDTSTTVLTSDWPAAIRRRRRRTSRPTVRGGYLERRVHARGAAHRAVGV